MAQDMNLKRRALRQFTKPAFSGTWEQCFILIMDSAVEHTDTDISYGEIGLPG